MATLNKVMLIGRLTDEPKEGAIATTGTRVVKFRFAVGRSKRTRQPGSGKTTPTRCTSTAKPSPDPTQNATWSA